MAYAPILNSSTYPGAEAERRLSLAAAALLQRLAASNVLRDALGVLAVDGHLDDLVIAEKLVPLLGEPSAKQDVLARLVDQLRQVKEFGELDGGKLEQYIGPVSRLIRSGRVELFAGRTAR